MVSLLVHVPTVFVECIVEVIFPSEASDAVAVIRAADNGKFIEFLNRSKILRTQA